jgi:hypothetical protein
MMKCITILTPLCSCFLFLSGQTLSPDVISSAGNYFETPNASLSWTLGETAAETFTNGNIILTQGFQQPLAGIVITGIDLDLLVLLEGPYNGIEMEPRLNSAGLIPLSQPYNQPPWNYPGAESVMAIPNMDVVDWVLVELRDAPNPAAALPANSVAMQAAFLLRDGSVVGLDGSSVLQFENTISQQLFAIVWHRNHLGIMTGGGVTASGDVYEYDFSLAASQVHGGSAGYKDLGGGVWGMAAGDANHDRIIDFNDKALWASFAGEAGYFGADLNLDGQTDNSDKNEAWHFNLNMSSQVPE